VVRRLALEFLKPARIDDVMEVETRVKQVGAASLTLSQTVRRGEAIVAEAEVVVVLVSVSGKPLRISATLREAFGLGVSAAPGAAK
jgi:acyl-CoA thioester hydrolase